MPENVAVLGVGYVGLVTGTCLAVVGNQVACYDVDPKRVQELSAGRVPIYEPRLEDEVRRGVQAGRLRFTDRPEEALAKAGVVFVAVGTPPGPDGAADLKYVWSAVDLVAKLAPKGAVLAMRSTVPPGTGDQVAERLARAGRSDVAAVSTPEFLAEGTAVKDFYEPDRIVIGGEPAARDVVAKVFRNVKPEAERVLVTRRTAELAKYAANSFLAARVSLINEMANLCDAVGADVRELSRVVGLDRRVGAAFLRPGIGYGGSCFPKDLAALAAIADGLGVDTPVLQAVQDTNARQWRRVLDRLQADLGSLKGRTVAVWGIAFKPGTDDTREAPGSRLMAALLEAGAAVRAHDPKARLPEDLRDRGAVQEADALKVLDGADALVLATEWPEYVAVPAGDLARRLKPGATVVDGRNVLPLDALRAAGLKASGVGTPAAPPRQEAQRAR